MHEDVLYIPLYSIAAHRRRKRQNIESFNILFGTAATFLFWDYAQNSNFDAKELTKIFNVKKKVTQKYIVCRSKSNSSTPDIGPFN